MGVFRCIVKRDGMLGLNQKSAASGPPKKRMPSKQEVEQSLRMMSADGRRAGLSTAGRPVLFAQSLVRERGGQMG